MTLPGLDRGNAVFDIRQRLTFNYVWELPFFQKTHGALGTVLGGWQWNGIWSFQSGAHWSPFRGGGSDPGPRFDDGERELATRPASIRPNVSMWDRTTTWTGWRMTVRMRSRTM